MRSVRNVLVAIVVGVFVCPVIILAADEVRTEVPAVKEAASSPLGFSLDYTLVSDYVWRGANFSEFKGEGREKLNHQIGAGITLDLEKLGLENMGTIGFGYWAEIYQANKSRRFDTTGGADTHVQEVDYTFNWTKSIDNLGVDLEAGWIIYEFPNLGGDAHRTYEFYGSVGFNDGPLFGQEEGILNPTVTYNYDYDVVRAGWLAVGFSHEFDLGNAAAELKRFTLTPSLTLGIDDGYWDKTVGTAHRSTKLTTMEYGLDLGYDLGAAVGLPKDAGSLSVTTFVRFSDAIREKGIGLNDEFYGGVTIGYEW